MNFRTLAECSVLCPALLTAATIRVPSEQPTIQTGIDAEEE